MLFFQVRCHSDCSRLSVFNILIGMPLVAYRAAVSKSLRFEISSRGDSLIALIYLANVDSVKTCLTPILGR